MAKKQPDHDSPAAWTNCEICRAQNSFGGGHWAWHRFCRAELNPIALLQFVEREQFGVVGDVIAGYIKAVTGMDIEAARAAMADEAPSSDARILKPEGSQASGSATESDLRTAIAHLTEERNELDVKLAETEARLSDAQQWLDSEPDWKARYMAIAVKREKQLAALTEVHERLRARLQEASQSRAFYEAMQAYRHAWSPADVVAAFEAVKTFVLDALLSPREGTQLQIDQELTNDLARRDTSGSPTDDPPQPPTGR